jgi:hypothetical protein
MESHRYSRYVKEGQVLRDLVTWCSFGATAVVSFSFTFAGRYGWLDN